VFQKYDPPLYFVTFNTYERRKLLATARVHAQLIEFAKLDEQRGIALGRYVIMPDHIHLFVRGGIDFVLTQWTRMLKRRLSNAISAPLPHWQKGFFDHVIRHSESYSEKREYVRQNPVRAGLVVDPGDWPWQGEIVRLAARCSGACVKHRAKEINRRLSQAPLQLPAPGITRFWLRSARWFETENCFAFFHQIETIARNGFQIGSVSLEQIDLARLMCEQILLLVYLLLQIVDLCAALH
jgi:putative transposase